MTSLTVNAGRGAGDRAGRPRHRSIPSDRRQLSLYLVGAVLWAILTLSLAAWWIVFGLQQIDALSSLEGAEMIARKHRMLVWEGVTLFVLLMGGSFALAYFIVRERRQRHAIKRFLATFTHELKTPIASLRLQAEALREEVPPGEGSRLIERLIADTSRLTLQLENSLQLAEGAEALGQPRSLMSEPIMLSELLASLRESWPMIAIERAGDAQISADRRAIYSIVQNIIQNSVAHGRATILRVTVRGGRQEGQTAIEFRDNGVGFAGEARDIGKLFKRHSPRSGSGIGLYLVTALARELGGAFTFGDLTDGFGVTLELPGVVIEDE